MKKLTAVLLMLTLILGLCACSPAGISNTGDGESSAPKADISGVFSVGFGRVNITPT